MTLDSAISAITNLVINPIIFLAFGIALLVFIWGGIQYIRGGDDPKVRADGVRNFTYGILGMAIMISAFGIAKFIQALLPNTQQSQYTQGYTPPDINSLNKNP
jgi:uncharacterized membrane protein